MKFAVLFWFGLIFPFSLTAQETDWGLPLTAEAARSSHPHVTDRYGVPFIAGTLPIHDLGAARVDFGDGQAKRIFLSGMTYAKPNPWEHARDYSMRFFIGDELGRIRLEYADGSTQIFPLILGESIWWGKLFRDYPEPFSSDARFRETLEEALRLYPATPVEDEDYLAVITPKPGAIRSLTLEASSIKWGVPVVDGITVEAAEGGTIRGAIALPRKNLSLELEQFVAEKALRPLGEAGNPKPLNDLRHALYTSDDDFGGHVAETLPPGYSGPKVTFKGNIFAEILTNAFHWNLQDMAGKVDEDGFYHTSSKNSQSWGGYNGMGTFAPNHGTYYGDSWTRDMGRSLQELAELGYTQQVARCADYCLKMARLWEENPALKFKGQVLPRHWGRIANKPGRAPPFENDGHGLVTMGLYKIWQRMPDRDRWLRSRWPDVKGAGDWILWQFAHPELSGAADGLLHTTGEFSSAKGFSVYADSLCMDGLNALAQMADSIGETDTAGQWRGRAAKMREAITARYVFNDPHFGRVWTTEDARYADKTTVLGPLMLLADYNGFAPEDDDPRWRAVNEATYRRLIANHLPPLGFYGRTMGYGQGFDTQSALLLDRMRDASRMLDWAAREIYDPKIRSYLVPEGCDIDPTNGHFWFKLGDLGNGVQEAEIIKALRLMMGVDDTQPDRLQFYPRMPYGWSEMAVAGIPVLFAADGKVETTSLHYRLERSGTGMKLEIGTARPVGPVAMRLGPFAQRPAADDIRVNGSIPTGASVVSSGDSWWVRFNASSEMMKFVFALFVTATSLGATLPDPAREPYLPNPGVQSRSISFENPTGAPGQGGKAASVLGVGRKGAACRSILPGETVGLCEIEGPGVIRHFWMTTSRVPKSLRAIVVRAYWDGQTYPSIECPLGDLMGSPHGAVTPYQSAVHSLGTSRGFNLWLPMPFAKQARITFSNEGDKAVTLYYQIDYTLGDQLPHDVGRLHVLFRRENPTTAKQDFELLPQRQGSGRYIGSVIGVHALGTGWWGEGEIKMYLDGDKEFPSYCGTGTEDYAGLGWGFLPTAYLYHGCSLAESPYFSFYRWYLPDPIYWRKQCRIVIQQLGYKKGQGLVNRVDDWSCATFWYEAVPSAPLPPMPDLAVRTADLWTPARSSPKAAPESKDIVH